MGSVTGRSLKLSLYGESHGVGIGVVIDGLPSGYHIDMDPVIKSMKRRAPGGSGVWATKRKEEDIPEIMSGIWNGYTTGTPLCAMIRNTDTRSSDYSDTLRIPRPGHADITGNLRYSGYSDPRGGGHFSGRLTAGMVFAGAVCEQILKSSLPLIIYSQIRSIGNVIDIGDAEYADDMLIMELMGSEFPVMDRDSGEKMRKVIADSAAEGDSVGGVIGTFIKGFPSGIGDPVFEGMESGLASAIFSIPGVKGVEFGSGFAGSALMGSQNNDVPFYPEDGENHGYKDISYKTNNSGGIQGGITNGMPIVIRTAFRPTASIGREQMSVDVVKGAETQLKVTGRHDPCIVPRAIPVIEAVCAYKLLDHLITSGQLKRKGISI